MPRPHTTTICCLDCLQHLTKAPCHHVHPLQSIVTKEVTIIFLYQNHGHQSPLVVPCCSQNRTQNPVGTQDLDPACFYSTGSENSLKTPLFNLQAYGNIYIFLALGTLHALFPLCRAIDPSFF